MSLTGNSEFPLLLAIMVVSVGYWFVRKLMLRLVTRVGREKHISRRRVQYVQYLLTIMLVVIALGVFGVIAGFGYKDVGLVFTSVFAVLGVALFAQWSILSNVTASVVVFFFFPYRVGDHVRIVDGENSVEGTIDEITMFHVILSDGDKKITYPNSLVFQKAVVIPPDNTPPAADKTDGDVL